MIEYALERRKPGGSWLHYSVVDGPPQRSEPMARHFAEKFTESRADDAEYRAVWRTTTPWVPLDRTCSCPGPHNDCNESCSWRPA